MFEGLDVDWFIFDRSGALVHFASGGGLLPDFIKEDNVEMANQLLSLPEISPQIVIPSDLNEVVNLNSNEERNNYINSFAAYAKRGIYSFDKSILNNARDPSYHLVASPTVKLIPSHIPLLFINTIPKIESFSASSILSANYSVRYTDW